MILLMSGTNGKTRISLVIITKFCIKSIGNLVQRVIYILKQPAEGSRIYCIYRIIIESNFLFKLKYAYIEIRQFSS